MHTYYKTHFVWHNDQEVLNKITKIMTQEFLKLNFNMNSEKTTLHSDIVIGAFKKDKVDRIDRNLFFPKKALLHPTKTKVTSL